MTRFAILTLAALLVAGWSGAAPAQAPPIEGELALITPVSEVHPRRGAQGLRRLREGKVERHREGERDPGGHAGGVRAHRRVEGQAGGRHLLGRRVGALREARASRSSCRRWRSPASVWTRSRRRSARRSRSRSRTRTATGSARRSSRTGSSITRKDSAPRHSRAQGVGRPPEPEAQGRGRPVRAHAVVVVERDLRGHPVDARRGQAAGTGSASSPATRGSSPRGAATCRPSWPRASSPRASRCRRTWRSRRSWPASISSSWRRRTPSSPPSPWRSSPAPATRRPRAPSSSSS